MAKRHLEKRREDGSVVFRIDRQRKTGEYVLNSDSSQAKYVAVVQLHGFEHFPSGFYRDGFGFTLAGGWLIRSLGEEFGSKLRVIISALQPSSVKRAGSTVTVIINHNRLTTVNNVVRGIKKDRNDQIRGVIDSFLAANFPDVFDEGDRTLLEYRPGRISQMLRDEDVVKNLSDEDKDSLRAIFPDLIGEMAFSLTSARKVRIVAEGLKRTQKVYLEEVVTEYERKLKGKSGEGAWQKFLRTHILTLLNTYAAVIEKQSVDLDGKYPDFMLIDAYGYLDVYEIKKPQTNLLKFDNSRKNYYWDTEMAKAISQTEKYLGSIHQYRLDLQEKLRKSGVNAKIVRPRGYIIAGKRSSLINEDMAEDCRILNDSLKNIDLIFYDDLLGNIKTLLGRLTTDTAK